MLFFPPKTTVIENNWNNLQPQLHRLTFPLQSVSLCVYVCVCKREFIDTHVKVSGETLLLTSWENTRQPTSKQQHVVNHGRPFPSDPGPVICSTFSRVNCPALWALH